MKMGKENKLDDVSSEITLTGSIVNINGFPKENILNKFTLQPWKVIESTVDLVIKWTTGFTAEMIGLFNVNLETNVTITTYSTYPTTSIESKVITASELTGFDYKNALFQLTNTTTNIVAIKLSFTGPTSSFKTRVGSLWVGDFVDFGCSEKTQPFDESADQSTLSRANTPDTNREYNFHGYSVTIKKTNGFLSLRSKIREILTTGYSTSRPMVIDEPFFSSPELFYGVFDAPRVMYDLIQGDAISDFVVQTTIGLVEVT